MHRPGANAGMAGLFYTFPALLLRWEMSFGWSKAELTAAITLAVFVSAFVAPLAGKIIDMGKGHIMMTLSTVLGGLCLIALSMVTELSQFYVVWGLMGVMMAGSMYEPCFALITPRPRRQSKTGNYPGDPYRRIRQRYQLFRDARSCRKFWLAAGGTGFCGSDDRDCWATNVGRGQWY